MAQKKEMCTFNSNDSIYLDEVFQQLIKQKFEREVNLVCLRQITDVGVQERWIFDPDVAIIILYAQTGEIEHSTVAQSKIFLEFHQSFLLDLFEQLLSLSICRKSVSEHSNNLMSP